MALGAEILMSLIQTVLVALLTLGVLVTIHEFGHYFVAKRCGVKVLRFAVGFGRPVLRWQGRSDTEFVIGLIPLGGYVQMLDERDNDVSPQDLAFAFNRQSVWRRIAIVAAGPAANFLLAIAVLSGLYLQGEVGLIPEVEQVIDNSPAQRAGLRRGQEIIAIDGHDTPIESAVAFRLLERMGDTGTILITVKAPDSDVVRQLSVTVTAWLAEDSSQPLRQLGVVLSMPTIAPIVDSLVAGEPADIGGFREGDRILRADRREIDDWRDWVDIVRARPGEEIQVLIDRDGLSLQLGVTPRATEREGIAIGQVGMGVRPPDLGGSQVRRFERGAMEALSSGVQRTFDLAVLTVKALGKMVTGLISPNNLSGPITIAQVAGDSAEQGWGSWLGFLALLSISLGTLNLLPVPVLDGGHLLFYCVEILMGREVPDRIQVLGYQLGLLLVLSTMVFALYNDVARL